MNSNVANARCIYNNHSNKIFIQMFILKLVKVVVKIVTGHDVWFYRSYGSGPSFLTSKQRKCLKRSDKVCACRVRGIQ